MRLAVTAGGTGGHILPALSVVSALRTMEPDLDVRFFGPENRGERYLVESAGLPFETVPAAAIRGKNPWQLTKAAASLAKGTGLALRKLRRFKADVVLSTGGYASFPCSLAARALRIPLVVFLPDVEPGWAVRAEKRLATRIATTTEAARRQLPADKTYVTGYPVRDSFRAADRIAARESIGANGTPVVLIAGASQGAAAINKALFRALPEMTTRAIVVHITGETDSEEAGERAEALPEESRSAYIHAPFRDDLPQLMVAADVAVMRAGASVLGEIPAARLPAVLVPGKFAGGHQRANAKWLVDGGAAEMLDETRIGELLPRVFGLLGDAERRAAMRGAAKKLDRPEAAVDIARIVAEVAR